MGFTHRATLPSFLKVRLGEPNLGAHTISRLRENSGDGVALVASLTGETPGLKIVGFCYYHNAAFSFELGQAFHVPAIP